MYQQTDYEQIRQQQRTRSCAVIACAGALAAATHVSFFVRWPQGITMVLSFLCCAAAIFGYTMFVSPVRAYALHIAHALEGRTRQTSGVFVSMEQESVGRDKIDFYPVTLNVGSEGREEDDRLFYMDANLPRPDWQVGEKLVLTSYDNRITHWQRENE